MVMQACCLVLAFDLNQGAMLVQRALFAATFGMSLTLLLLVVLEILDVFQGSERHLLWRRVLQLILLNLVAVLPFNLMLQLVGGIHGSDAVARALKAVLAWLSFLVGFAFIDRSDVMRE